MDQAPRPWLAAAFFCERVLDEKGDVRLNYRMPNIRKTPRAVEAQQRAKTAGLTLAGARRGGHVRLPQQRTSGC